MGVMFGPDLTCPGTKVHFIFRHKSPKTGETEEKHLKVPPRPTIEKLTNLYTLIVNPDNTFEILINGESEKKGSLLEDFDPAVNPPKEIEDPDDFKPADWVDEATIADPDAKKPDDWDEDAPYQIVDEDAVKPEGWLDDEPLSIPDPDATKPEDGMTRKTVIGSLLPFLTLSALRPLAVLLKSPTPHTKASGNPVRFPTQLLRRPYPC
ncbi:Calreticulin family-domain-containing protein [Flammula alnicola]|nr:Calreticulin family-domain-containing protein [Flammula alnicola]